MLCVVFNVNNVSLLSLGMFEVGDSFHELDHVLEESLVTTVITRKLTVSRMKL